MNRRSKLWAGLVGFLLALLLLAAGDAVAREILEVEVVNWPALTSIRGSVSIDGPIRHSEVDVFSDVVTTVRPTETTRLVDAGVLDVDGYSSVVLSIEGETRGDRLAFGKIGAILVPDKERAKRAMLEEQMFFFPLEVDASISARETKVFVNGAQKEFRVAFSRYRVFFYNTTKNAVDMTLTVHKAN